MLGRLGGRGRWRVPAVLAVVVAVGGCDALLETREPGAGGAGVSASGTPTEPGPSVTAQPGTSLDSQSDGQSDGVTDYHPARFAASVLAHAASAEVNPQLLMAILFNESYKPHDPAFERAWQSIKPDAAFGIANMHKPAFDEAKQGRDFADRDWQELPDDPDLAVQAAAWYLHDLAAQLPDRLPEDYTRDELLALGYNAGAGSMLAFVDGARPGEVAQSYLDRLRANWSAAADALAQAK